MKTKEAKFEDLKLSIGAILDDDKLPTIKDLSEDSDLNVVEIKNQLFLSLKEKFGK